MVTNIPMVALYEVQTLPVKTIQINYLADCVICEVNYETIQKLL